MKCEICGSEDIERHTEEKSIQVRYGSKEWYLSIKTICQECNSIILTEDSNQYYQDAIKRSIEYAVFKILKILESNHSFITYERILGLDFGTFDDWKTGKNIPSKTEIALLYIVVNNIDLIIHQHF